MAFDDPVTIIIVIAIIIAAIALISYAASRLVNLFKKADRFLDEQNSAKSGESSSNQLPLHSDGNLETSLICGNKILDV